MIGQCIRHYVHFPTPPGTAGSSFLITKPSCFRGPTQHYKPLSFNEMSGQYMITARYHITNMDRELVPKRDMVSGGAAGVPAVVMAAGEKAGLRFVEFFTANIRNPNTRRAYHRALHGVFSLVRISRSPARADRSGACRGVYRKTRQRTVSANGKAAARRYPDAL